MPPPPVLGVFSICAPGSAVLVVPMLSFPALGVALILGVFAGFAVGVALGLGVGEGVGSTLGLALFE